MPFDVNDLLRADRAVFVGVVSTDDTRFTGGFEVVRIGLVLRIINALLARNTLVILNGYIRSVQVRVFLTRG